MKIHAGFFEKKSTKDAIIEILGSEWPLSLKRIYNKLGKKYNLGITYQATHKAINELVEEKILQKEKMEYKLNIDWINNIERLGKKLKQEYTRKEQLPFIEVGCGSSVEKDGFEAGKEAAQKAVNEIRFYEKYTLAFAFISSEYEGQFEEILKGVYTVIRDTQLVGCTGVAEVKDKRLYGSVVITIIASCRIEAKTSIIKDITLYASDYDKASQHLINENSINENSFGILFTAGVCEDNAMVSTAPSVIESLKSLVGKNFPIIGAESGDDWKFKKTYQFYNQDVYSNAVILTLVKTDLKWAMQGKSAYNAINKKTYKIKVEDNCIVKMAQNEKKVQYKPALPFYEREIGLSHKEFKQIIPLFIKERISQNILDPISDVNEPDIASHPIMIIDKGIRFKYNFNNDKLIQIKKTTPPLLVKTVNTLIDEAIDSNNIKKPALILIFPCAIFEAILSKRGIKEIELLKKQDRLNACRIIGTYVYGEIGFFNDKTKYASGTVVSLIIGDELKEEKK